MTGMAAVTPRCHNSLLSVHLVKGYKTRAPSRAFTLYFGTTAAHLYAVALLLTPCHVWAQVVPAQSGIE
jgi:hypothetical protein